ncbi:MAG: S66 peptidase family protein [Janthinobacterium lividum]
MKRRTLLAGAAAGIISPALAQPSPPLTKPKMLRQGDRVAVVDPSTAIYDPAAIERARLIIEALNLVPVFAPHTLGRSREFKTSVRERLADLHDAFADPSIKGVFCARGGYGVSEVVSEVDYSLIRRNPRVFLGFSDITLLHLAIRKQAGLVTFHGRMPALTQFPAYSLEALRRAVCSPGALGRLANPTESDPLRPLYPLRTITPGAATGRLTGGNLSMIAAAMGTGWEIDTRGAVFFFEDVDEQPYAIARMLFELRQAGKLANAAAIVIGTCAGCNATSDTSPYTLNEVFDLVLGDLNIPVFSGLVLGHTDEQMTVPLGVPARVDATACSLEILEPGVS